MNPLLISGFGTSISVDRRKLMIQNPLSKQKFEFYPHRIDHDSIIVDGHTGNITFESMRWLMKHGISLTLLNWDGNLLSVTLPESPISGKLRLKQYQKYLDHSIRYKIASGIVKSKIGSSMNLLEQVSRFHPLDMRKTRADFESELSFFASKKPSITELLGCEGRIARIYFDALRPVLSSDFRFDGRMNHDSKRNIHASDEVNAMLNYGYSILVSEVRKCIHSVGLDPDVGFLHETKNSSMPLVYDVQELFRWIIDLSVIEILEEKILRKSDFIITERYHTRLHENAAKLLIEKIRDNFNRKVSYKKKNFAYQTILYDKVQQLANFIIDKKSDIDLKIPDYKIERDDTVSLKDNLLKMTSDERKKCGINKSTLWYIKKNLESNKKTKFYKKTLSKF
jgi:CRISP-associated protein Cas1